MKRIHYIVIFLVVSCVAKAQDFQGQAFYFSKTSMDTNFGGRQLSEDQKKAIVERMSKRLTIPHVPVRSVQMRTPWLLSIPIVGSGA